MMPKLVVALVLAGCATDPDQLRWNLDKSSCARAGADRVEWAFVRDQNVVEDSVFPCADGEGWIPSVPAPPVTIVVTLQSAQSQVLMKCTPVLRRSVYTCYFAVP